MSLWMFDPRVDIEEVVLNSFGDDMLIDSGNPDEIVCFSNGDKITINTKTGQLDYDTIAPGEFTHSKVQLRLHQWISKGYIWPEKEDHDVQQN